MIDICDKYKVVKVINKSMAKGLEDVIEGDVLELSIDLKKRGADRNNNWKRPLVKISNLRTGEFVYKEFSITVKVLDNFELEKTLW